MLGYIFVKCCTALFIKHSYFCCHPLITGNKASSISKMDIKMKKNVSYEVPSRIKMAENVAYEVPPSRIKTTENEAYGTVPNRP